MQPPSDDRELLARLQNLEALIDQESNPAAQARLMEIVQTLLEFHATGLRKILQAIESAPGAKGQIINALCRDTVVCNLLILHELHPLDFETRVRTALDKVRPYLASHGGHVELLSVSRDGAVRLRLEGSCHGCPSSRVTLQSLIEEELYAAAPEIASLDVEGLIESAPARPGGFVPLGEMSVKGVALQAAPQ
jgi:Fe-S cluster biogenesis protein NfuA